MCVNPAIMAGVVAFTNQRLSRVNKVCENKLTATQVYKSVINNTIDQTIKQSSAGRSAAIRPYGCAIQVIITYIKE